MSKNTENNKKLKAFFEKEYNALISYVSSKLKESINRNPEDIVQEVALKLFSGADNYLPINNVTHFVYRSIKNKVIDVMRKGKEYTPEQDDIKEEKLIDFFDLVYGDSDNGYSEDLIELLKTCILNLKPDYKNIIMLIDFEGYSYKEISLELGIPIGTLMSRRHRALAILVKQIKEKQKKKSYE